MANPADILQAVNQALFCEAKLDAIDRYFTSDYTAHFTGGQITGYKSIRTVVGTILKAFSDIEVDVKVLVDGNARVAWRRTMKGRQTGPFKGFPASGKSIVWTDMIVSEFREGKIAEEWVVTDLAERLLLARKH
jgi:steroid delta-isomerase-like uncharacterized protein